MRLIALAVVLASVTGLAMAQDGAEPPTFPKTWQQAGIMLGTPTPADREVTWANWQFGPYNRWSFQNVREVLPTAVINHARPDVAPLPRRERTLDDLAVATREYGTLTLRDVLRLTYSEGLLVMHRGEVVYETYLNGMQPGQPHLVWSVSKSWTGDLAGILVAEGKLDLAKTVADYVPELAQSGWGSSTVREVIDMVSGSGWIEDYADANSTVRRQDTSTMLLPRIAGEHDDIPDGNYNFLPTVVGKAENSGRFIYKSGDTDVAAWVLERAGGARLPDLLRDKLFGPLGAEFPAYITRDRSGFVLASGGMNITLGDLARFGEMNRNMGRANGRQVVPEAWIRDRRENGNKAAFTAAGEGFEGGHYRSFWWHSGNPHGAYYAQGVHGQFVYVDPVAEAVIVKLSSHPDAGMGNLSHMEFEAFAAIIAALMEAP